MLLLRYRLKLSPTAVFFHLVIFIGRTLMGDKMTLGDLIQNADIIVAPGAYDGLTAKLVRDAGFPAVYLSGASVSVGYGYPDYGLLTMSEMLETAGRMTDAVEIPVIADIDTGYGNELNTYRAVRAFEKMGVAAIQIEDQVFPKRCGHLDEKEVVSEDEFMSKIKAAVDARSTSDLAIIARTDARAVENFDSAIRRCAMALEEGADIVFFEAPQNVEEIERVPKLVDGPCLLNLVYGGKTPMINIKTAASLGYEIVIVPGLAVATVISALEDSFASFRDTGVHPEFPDVKSPREIFNRAGAADWDVLRSQYQL